MWKSPIDISSITREIIIRESAKDLKKETDELIMKAFAEVGIDKEELIKCIDCDKRSYEKGYEEGSIKVIDKFLKCLEEYVAYSYDHLTYSKIADLAERFKKELEEDYREQKLKR